MTVRRWSGRERTPPDRSASDQLRMRRAIGVATLLNVLDGYDILAAAIAAPVISVAWKLPPAELGGLLSAGLLGMMLGSLLVAPFADRLGDTRMTLGALALMGAGMIAAGLAQSVTALVLARLACGLGVGALIPTVSAGLSATLDESRRDAGMMTYTLGYPLGAALTALGALAVLGLAGWRALFISGGLLTVAAALLVPETFSRPAGVVRARGGSALIAVLGRDSRSSTLAVCYVFLVQTFGMYFVLSWTTKIMADGGHGAFNSLAAVALVNLGGVAGGLAAATLVRWSRVTLLAQIMLSGFFLMNIAFAASLDSPTLLMPMAFLLGAFMFSSMSCFYAVAARAFPVASCATGMGLAIGTGRFGGAISPIVAGLLIEAGLSTQRCMVVMTLPLLSACAVLPVLDRRRDRSSASVFAMATNATFPKD